MTEIRTEILGRALCLAGASFGAVGLAGWLAGIEPLITVIPGQPPMMPNTAIGLLLLGIAGALHDPKQPGRARISLSAMAAIVALAIGLGTLAEYVIHLQINLDQLFIRFQSGPYPSRPSPLTALSIALLATAILIVDSRPHARVRSSEWLTLTTAVIAFTALLGQLFGVGPLYRFSHTPVIGVAVHTALSLLLISLGLFLERGDAGLMRVFTASGPGGVLLRRLTLPAILTPVAFGLIAARFLQIPGVENIDTVDFLFASLVVLSTVASLFLIAVTATRLDRTHDALEQATQARDEVLGVVAHDLRNPLQIITINADLLRRSGPERASGMAEQIGDAANRMNRLIQDLVDVTSMESGHLSLRPERLYAAEIVSESVDMQTPLTTSASLELRVTIAPDLPDIWADRDRILQVFENLIGNAIKFTKAGGNITLGAEPSAGEVEFSVSDTGSGIADGDLPHVFDRFWQASHGAHRGAGLGLAIVKGIVEAHGGRIWVHSTAGQGTTFFFTIPMAPQARQQPEARPPRINALPAATD